VSYGVIVEGIYDIPVFEELIRRIAGDELTQVIVRPIRPTGGKAALMSGFHKLLWSFAHVTVTGGPVERALVVRDCNGGDPVSIETEMARRIAGKEYPFRRGVGLHAVRRETETWLLADANAISRVAGGKNVRAIEDPLEEIVDAKRTLTQLLDVVDLPYTPAICGAIARELDLTLLRAASASFRSFEQKVARVS
jgi:hypothetical protein